LKPISIINHLRKKGTLYNTAIVFILRFSGLILAYLVNVFIANNFGKEVYGNFVTTLTLLEIFSMFASLGLAELIIKLTADVSYSNKGIPLNTFLKKSVILVLFSSVIFSTLFFYALK
jgi:O-antigen/teichoic acid export membrane protein|tara:strand:- start:4761 stop:5114 length:354 start_codon:yes stop_codon:yes gene_type:complete